MFLQIFHWTNIVDLVVVGQQPQAEFPSLGGEEKIFGGNQRRTTLTWAVLTSLKMMLVQVMLTMSSPLQTIRLRS